MAESDPTEASRSGEQRKAWRQRLSTWTEAAWRRRGPIVNVAAYLSLALVIVALFGPTTVRRRLLGLSAGGESGESFPVVIEAEPTEALEARADHLQVATWVANCLGYASVWEMPDRVAIAIAYPQPMGPGIVSRDDSKPAVDGEPAIKALPTSQQREVVGLSSALFRKRVSGAGSVEAATKRSALMQWIIILAGLATTIVVSLSATDYGKGDKWTATSVRLFAIMLPAFGTAVAALNAFYAPAQKSVQASRTLSSLQALHSQIALEVWQGGCTKDPAQLTDAQGAKANQTKWEALDAKIAQWVKRYQEIGSIDGAPPVPQQGGGASPGGAPQQGTPAPQASPPRSG